MRGSPLTSVRRWPHRCDHSTYDVTHHQATFESKQATSGLQQTIVSLLASKTRYQKIGSNFPVPSCRLSRFTLLFSVDSQSQLLWDGYGSTQRSTWFLQPSHCRQSSSTNILLVYWCKIQSWEYKSVDELPCSFKFAPSCAFANLCPAPNWGANVCDGGECCGLIKAREGSFKVINVRPTFSRCSPDVRLSFSCRKGILNARQEEPIKLSANIWQTSGEGLANVRALEQTLTWTRVRYLRQCTQTLGPQWDTRFWSIRSLEEARV